MFEKIVGRAKRMKKPRQLLLDRHHSAQAGLDKVRHAVVSEQLKKSPATSEPTSVMQRLWCELFLPVRGVWSGIAAAWLVILVLHGAASEDETSMAKENTPTKMQIEVALREQRRILAELNEDYAVADKPRNVAPRPRSEAGSPVRFA